jgi:hypothetical protein
MVYNPRRIQPRAQTRTTRIRIHRLNLMNTAVAPAGDHAYLLGQLEEPAIHLHRPHRECCALYASFFISLLKMNRRLAGTLSTSGHAVGHVQINDTVAAIRLRTRHHDPYEEWAKRTRIDAFVCPLNSLSYVPVSVYISLDSENCTPCSYIRTKSARCSARRSSRTGCQKASHQSKARGG